MAAAQTILPQQIAMEKVSACAEFATATDEPIQKKGYMANIVNATISHVNVFKAYCVVVLIVAFAHVVSVSVSQAGLDPIVRAETQRIPV